MEWFLTGRIGHLWKENCKEEALRNVLIDENESTEVEIEFGELNTIGKKSLASDLQISDSNSDPDFLTFLAQASKERIILRHNDIATFILQTKTRKRDEIEAIIGFDEIRKFRKTIRVTLSRLESDPEFIAAKGMSERAEADLLDLADEVIATRKALFEKVDSLMKPVGVDIAVKDETTYSAARQKLKSAMGDPKRAETKVQFDSLAGACSKVTGLADRVKDASEALEERYTTLSDDKESIEQIKKEAFLNMGVELIQAPGYSESVCPFCQVTHDIEELCGIVEERILAIDELKQKHEAAKQARVALSAALSDLQRHLDGIHESYEAAGVATEYFRKLTAWSEALSHGLSSLDLKFRALRSQSAENVSKICGRASRPSP